MEKSVVVVVVAKKERLLWQLESVVFGCWFGKASNLPVSSMYLNGDAVVHVLRKRGVWKGKNELEGSKWCRRTEWYG